MGVGGPFALWLLGISVAHHAFAMMTHWRLYRLSSPGGKGVAWYALAGLVIDWIVARSIRSCLTGEVNWRGTSPRRGSGRRFVVARPVSKAG